MDQTPDSMRVIILVAMTPDGLIGAGGKLPWHEPADLRHFKRTTMGHAIIMGRKTYDSIGKPLPGRRNVVITRNRKLPPTIQPANEGPNEGPVDFVGSLDEALDLCRGREEAIAFVIGGAQVFAPALEVADQMIVTWIDRPGLTGDTYFPAWDPTAWEQVAAADEGGLRVMRYRRLGD